MAEKTLTLVSSLVKEGPIRVDRFTYTGPTSYTTGGDTGLAAKIATACGDGRVPKAIIARHGVDGYHLHYNPTTDKFIIMYSDLNGAGDGPDIEVPNATNLDTTTFDFTVLSI